VTARQRYASELTALADDEVPAYLTERSGLPGPRSNLELLYAFGDVAPAPLVVRLADDQDEYLRCCGTAALGRLILEAPGDARLTATLTERARDASWRVREGAAMAGQRIGAASPEGLAGLVGRWLDTGDPLVARAAVAAACEPPILRPSPLLRAVALDACVRATDILRAVPAARRREADVRTLRQALGYCWSVAIAADHSGLVPFAEDLGTDTDPDVMWIVRENLRKKRLAFLVKG
jgi:hypothetical protein